MKASSRTSALLSGFAMVAMVEIQIDDQVYIFNRILMALGESSSCHFWLERIRLAWLNCPQYIGFNSPKIIRLRSLHTKMMISFDLKKNIDILQIPQGLLITFAACTVLLIAVHMLALMISTCILPNVEAVANLHFQTSKTVFESPHMKMGAIVELAWGFSTVLGILLFLAEIAILCWVKFYNISHDAAWIATGLLIPIMLVFIAFAAHFYLKLVSHKAEVYEEGIKELEEMKGQLVNAEEGQGDQAETDATNSVVQVV